MHNEGPTYDFPGDTETGTQTIAAEGEHAYAEPLDGWQAYQAWLDMLRGDFWSDEY